ncbi:Dimethylsulfide dehydrogenase beta subunit [gamma proteobacterium HdN1]|nr:Dimethylsulfide dehydrogenase beta subunit [gamma proteobacterium HdN1]
MSKPIHTDVKPKRQVAMVLDLNKCLGCQTCTIACKTLWNKDHGTDYAYWNNVETHPGQGFPKQWQEKGSRTDQGQIKRSGVPNLDNDYGRAWKFNHEKTFFRGTGNGAGNPSNDASSNGAVKQWLKPEGDPKWGPNWDEDQGKGNYPEDNYYFYLPRLCNHCTHPACKEACPRGAIEKREQDGIVVVNQDHCNGYRFCVEACPYKKVYFDTMRQVASKCFFCFPRIEKGIATACARQCPGRIRYVGYLDDENGPIHKLVHKWKVALPLHEEYGTGPNVFYVPPMSPEKLDENGNPTGEDRIPLADLEYLFGPNVSYALNVLKEQREIKKQGQASELMDTLIAYDWNENFALGDGQKEVI